MNTAAVNPQVHGIFDPATWTVTYVVYEKPGSACAIIDSVLDYDPKSGRTSHKSADKVIEFVKANNLKVEWIMETHAHADHLSAAPYLKQHLGGKTAIGDHISGVQKVFKGIFNMEASFKLDGSQFDHLFADGDTITVRNRDGAIHKIRMHAIDSPELKQAGGEQARNWLIEQVMNRDVKIVVNNTDRYQRQVAKVVLPVAGCEQRLCDGEVDVNLQAIAAGHAWWYREYSRSQSSQDRVLYEAAEEKARNARKGLWRQTAPLAPWQWRTEQRNQR